MSEAGAPIGVEFELPDGWVRLAWDRPHRVGGQLAATGTAPHLLVRLPDDREGPGSPAILGVLLVRAPLPVGPDDLRALLDAQGESVAQADLDGVPLLAIVRREPATAQHPLPTVLVTYLLACAGATLLLVFEAVPVPSERAVVREIARVVSAARIVRDCAGNSPPAVITPCAAGMNL